MSSELMLMAGYFVSPPQECRWLLPDEISASYPFGSPLLIGIAQQINGTRRQTDRQHNGWQLINVQMTFDDSTNR